MHAQFLTFSNPNFSFKKKMHKLSNGCKSCNRSHAKKSCVKHQTNSKFLYLCGRIGQRLIRILI